MPESKESKEKILITSATGKIGTALVSQLAGWASQPEVLVATRNVNSPAAQLLKAMNPATVKLVEFRDDEPQTIKTALQGVTKICVIPPFIPDMAVWHKELAWDILSSGSCEYIVKVSVTGARGPDTNPPPGRVPFNHWLGEKLLRETGVPITVIRPNIFMQHYLMDTGLYTRGDNKIYLPTGTTGVSFLDCRDIANMAAHLLCATPEMRRPYLGLAYELTGPAAISAGEMAETLSHIAGRKIEHVDSETVFETHCQQLGIPDNAKHFYKEAREGWFSQIEFEAYRALTGYLPTSFATFAADHAAYFQVYKSLDNNFEMVGAGSGNLAKEVQQHAQYTMGG